MGHRDQKKRRIRAAIIENSIALFSERGFDATRIQNITRPLELSDATFFNYFPSKDAVLTEWVRDLVERAFAQAAGRSNERSRSVARAAARALAEQVRPEAALLGTQWHRIRQSAGHAPPGVRELIANGQARGELRADLPAQQVADLLVAGLVVALGSWLTEQASQPEATQPTASVAALGSRLQSAVDLVLDGSRKRNERVRAPAAPSVPAPRT